MPRLDFRNSDPLPLAKELVEKFHVGGFIVFGGELKQVREAIKLLQSISITPLFFACDAERGVGQIVSGATRFPFTMSLGAIGDEELVYRQAEYISHEMKQCGLNLVLAPVVDVNTNPENPIINIRSYGDDPQLVSRLGSAFVRGCQDGGTLACAKHFPGHGSVAIDSHITLPHSVQSREDFFNRDLIPFKDTIKAEVASIMAAHLAVSGIDSAGVPATISSRIVEELLIRDLGFKGLILTDSFFMGAIAELGDEKDVAPLSILSGCDIVLDPKDPVGVIKRLNAMVGKGRLSQLLIDRSVKKLVEAKEKWLYGSSCEKSFDEDYGKNLVEEIAQRSVCLLKGGKLSSNKATVYVLDVTGDETDISSSFFEALTNAEISCGKYSIVPSNSKQFASRSESSKGAVICVVYTSVAAWKGHTNLPGIFKEFLTKVVESNCEKIFISFGSPYAVRGFEKFDTILCAFDSLEVCQKSVADVLLGRLEAQGRLPVTL